MGKNLKNLPIPAGERLGHLEVWLGTEKINSVPLVSENEVGEKSFLKTILSFADRMEEGV